MTDLLQNLNDQQREAATHNKGPLLIVAGAGTGKTTVITSRIGWLIETGKCKPEEILSLTFTDKAAGEMEERVDKILPYGYVNLWISTFHAFAEKILHEYGMEIGLPGDFKLLSTTGQWMLIKNNLDLFELDYYKPLGNPTKHIHALMSHFSRAKDENITVSDYQNYVDSLNKIKDQTTLAGELFEPRVIEKLEPEELTKAITQELKKFEEIANSYKIYQQLLLDNNALDFGDLINYLIKLFRQRKNILARYRAQFKYILVDEFQDTNFAQYELIKMLASPDNNITVVGDDDQAIYKFRGASISNILQFKDDYRDTKEIFLNTNYRSAQNILDLSYEFIKQNNPYRLEIKLAKDRGGKGLSKKLDAHNDMTGKIEHIHSDSLDNEAVLVARKIIEIYNQNKDLKWSDIAILIRANSSANDFIQTLEMAKIPYTFVASKGLYSKSIVLDILAFLKLLDNYHESVALHRLVSMPLWKFPYGDIVNLNYFARRKGWSLYETMHRASEVPSISIEGKKKVRALMRMITEFSQMTVDGRRPTEIVQTFVDKSGYLKYLTSEDNVKNLETLSHLNQFFKKIQEFEKEDNEKSIKNFLTLINLELESGEHGSLSSNSEQDDPDTVKIMTIHASKGLEFEYVFLPNMVDKRFPTIGRKEAIALPDKLIKETTPEGDIHLQEERRLFYVAITRAKCGVFFSTADDYGGARKKKISRFLTELSNQGFKLSEKAETVEIEGEEKAENKSNVELKPKVPTKFSFTRLKAFETCPYQYRYSFILKVPTQGKPAFSFGRSMHTTMHKLFQLVNKRIYPTQRELLPQDTLTTIDWKDVKQIYEESFIDDWYSSQEIKKQYWDKGMESLKQFYKENKDRWPKSENLEYPFNLHIKSEDDNYTLYGVIDRIDKVEGGVRIVDYKTGTPKSKLTLSEKEQLLIYQMAVESVLKEPVKELIFHYFDDNSQVSFLGKDKELEKTREKVIKNIEGIKRGDFSPTPGMMCKYCDFNSICEYRKA